MQRYGGCSIQDVIGAPSPFSHMAGLILTPVKLPLDRDHQQWLVAGFWFLVSGFWFLVSGCTVLFSKLSYWQWVCYKIGVGGGKAADHDGS